jgi:hydrogenase nickel incorporation protein HypA/HybF
MHELALAQGVVEIVTDHAARQGFSRCRVVHLKIGALSSVMPEALALGFEVSAQGTVAEGARLEFHRTPGQAWCSDCSKTAQVESRLELCPSCGGAHLVVTGGDEMRVLELEVD